MRGLFVTGTDTGVGKSVVSAALAAAMLADGAAVRPLKPVLTGLDEPPDGPWPADDELLAGLVGLRREQVAPLRFGPAVSPHLAAGLAGTELTLTALLAGAREAAAAAGRDGLLLVEGVGGLLVPLSDGLLVREFAAALGLPIVIAARPGLGTINHSLMTLALARAAKLRVAAVVLTPWPAQPDEIERSNRDTIEAIGEVEVHTLDTLAGPDPAALAAAGARLPWRSWLG